MPRLDECRTSLLESLDEQYGRPADSAVRPIDESSPFESLVWAGLDLVADTRVAEAALEAFREAGLLEPQALASVDPAELDDLFRSSKIKLAARAIRPIQRIARWAVDHDISARPLTSWSTESLREAWRGLNGVGPATADSLLLIGLRRPTYPVDRATYRILVRHGWADPSADYDEARAVAESMAPEDPAGLGRLTVALRRLGRDYCKPAIARCDRCPLRPMLPAGGPVEVGE